MNMLINISITLLSLLSMNALISCQIPFPKSCQNVEIIKDFDVNKYMGKWYVYLTYPYSWYTGIKCLHHTYENEKNGLIAINTSTYFELTNYTNAYNTTAKMDGSEGLLKLNHMNIHFHSSDYVILGTDYDNWSVVYSCKSFTSLMHTEMVWILTRQRQPTIDAVKDAKRIMSNNDVSVKFLVSMNQTNCPDEIDIELNLTNRTANMLSKP
uniref:Lipocalin/cytosolic fatty-acid binding domain-containing protein n=1 Tax=Glossina brevipalpis TaxID=37001 RepID=A0A1A9VZK5_9MUSC